MTNPLVKINKEIMSLDSLGGSGGFPDIVTSSLPEIKKWVGEHLPGDIDVEVLMGRVKKIREQAGIADPEPDNVG